MLKNCNFLQKLFGYITSYLMRTLIPIQILSLCLNAVFKLHCLSCGYMSYHSQTPYNLMCLKDMELFRNELYVHIFLFAYNDAFAWLCFTNLVVILANCRWSPTSFIVFVISFQLGTKHKFYIWMFFASSLILVIS